MAGAGRRAMRPRKSKTYVELEGQDDIRRAFARLDFAALRNVIEQVKDSAEVIERDAKAAVAVDEGTTHDSIRIIYYDKGLSASVGTGHFVGRFLEQGVNGKPARPFLNPAFQAERNQYIKGVEDALNSAGREASR